VRHRLGLATRTQISVCKSPFPCAGTAEPVQGQSLEEGRYVGAFGKMTDANKMMNPQHFGSDP